MTSSNDIDDMMAKAREAPPLWYRPKVTPLIPVLTKHWFDSFLSSNNTEQNILSVFSQIGLLNEVEQRGNDIEHSDINKPKNYSLPPLPPSFVQLRKTINKRLERLDLKDKTDENEISTTINLKTYEGDYIPDLTLEGTKSSSTVAFNTKGLDRCDQNLQTKTDSNDENIKTEQYLGSLNSGGVDLNVDECETSTSFKTCDETLNQTENSLIINEELGVQGDFQSDHHSLLNTSGLSPEKRTKINQTFEDINTVTSLALGVCSSWLIEQIVRPIMNTFRSLSICAYNALSFTRLLVQDWIIDMILQKQINSIALKKESNLEAYSIGRRGDESQLELTNDREYRVGDNGIVNHSILEDMLNALFDVVGKHRGIGYTLDVSLPPGRFICRRLSSLVTNDPNESLFALLTYTDYVIKYKGNTNPHSMVNPLNWSRFDDLYYRDNWAVDEKTGMPCDLYSKNESKVVPEMPMECKRLTSTLKAVSIDTLDVHLRALIDNHPSLAFLRVAHEFVAHFLTTIRCRMEFRLTDSIEDCSITLEALRGTCIAMAWANVETVTETISIRQFFGYESFYVVFYKFYDLDGNDHDMLLNPSDFQRYDNYALIHRAIERLFDPSFPFLKNPGQMTYREYLFFLWLDEDKTSSKAIRFWFNFFDLDGDGRVSSSELSYFFTEQHTRYEAIMQENLVYDDTLCQMNDVMMPKVPGIFTIEDFQRHPRLIATLIDTIVSITKAVRHDQADPYFKLNDIEDHPYDDEWDRYIRMEYGRLASQPSREDSG